MSDIEYETQHCVHSYMAEYDLSIYYLHCLTIFVRMKYDFYFRVIRTR